MLGLERAETGGEEVGGGARATFLRRKKTLPLPFSGVKIGAFFLLRPRPSPGAGKDFGALRSGGEIGEGKVLEFAIRLRSAFWEKNIVYILKLSASYTTRSSWRGSTWPCCFFK